MHRSPMRGYRRAQSWPRAGLGRHGTACRGFIKRRHWAQWAIRDLVPAMAQAPAVTCTCNDGIMMPGAFQLLSCLGWAASQDCVLVCIVVV